MEKSRYLVVVSNFDVFYDGDSQSSAEEVFNRQVAKSVSGNCGGNKKVSLLRIAKEIKTYQGK